MTIVKTRDKKSLLWFPVFWEREFPLRPAPVPGLSVVALCTATLQLSAQTAAAKTRRTATAAEVKKQRTATTAVVMA